MTLRCLFLLFVFYSTTLFGYQDDEIILDTIEAIVNNKELSNKIKHKKILDYLNNTNLGLSETKVGFFYYSTGKLFYSARQYESAVIFTEDAIDILKKHTDTELLLLKTSLSNLGIMTRKLNVFSKSIDAYKEILKLPGRDLFHGKAYRELARFYFEAGDYERANTYIEKAIEIQSNLSNTKDLYLAQTDKVNFSLTINPQLFKESILRDLKIADSLLEKLTNKKKVLQYKITTNLFKGYLYYKNKEYSISKKYYEEALALSIKRQDHNRIYRIQNNLGLVYFRLKDYSTTYKTYQKILSNADVPIVIESDVHNNLGDYYMALNDFTNAEKMYLKSVKILLDSTGEIPSLNEISTYPNKSSLQDLLEQTADFYIKKYELTQDTSALQKALQHIKLVDGLIDIIRLENKNVKSKLYWRTKGKALYLKGIKVAHLLNNKADAFYFIEKSKVLLLLEGITDEKARQLSGIPDELQNTLFQFKTDISTIQEELLYAETENKDSLKDVLFTAKRRQSLFKDSLYIAYPDYARLRKAIKIIDEKDTSDKILNEKSAVVSYVLYDDEGYGFVRTNNQSHLFRIEQPKQLTALLNTIEQKVKTAFYTEDDFKSFNQLSKKAYGLLFEDIEPFLEGKTELIIVPDESMAKFPFEVLQKTINDKDPLHPHYLLFDTNISYALSISHLNALHDTKADHTERFLGIAPIDFKNVDLVSLPYSEHETREINNLFSGKLLLKENATKEASIQDIHNHAIIHIASHSNYDGIDNSWLWFYDDKLTLAELYGIKNNAELVVLNACKTLQGNEVLGEGVMSISRGFFASGSKSVVASLWNSNDNSSKKVTSSFYQNLKNKLSKDEALSLAKKEYLNTHQGSELSPYYWASITITGDKMPLTPEIFQSKHNYFLYIIIGLCILLVILLIYFRNSSLNKD